MDSEQQTTAPLKNDTSDKSDSNSANGRNIESPARVIVMSVRLWAYGGQQRKLRDFVWQPEGPMAKLLGALARESSGMVVGTRKNLLALSFEDPLHALVAARALQQKLLAISQGPVLSGGEGPALSEREGPAPGGECIVAAIAIYAQAPSKPSRRRGSDSSTEDDDLRRPLKETDLPQILVTEEVYKQVKDAPGFEFSDRPIRAAGGSRPTEMMCGLKWADGPTYAGVRQAIHEASMPRFSRYAITSELGRGTMGVVYKAHDQSIDRTVALKTISLSSSAADLEESVERLRQEGKAAGNLDHPNIITIYDVGQEDGFFYLSMQFVEGANFSALLANGRLQPLSTVLSYIDQICAAVGFAHQRGVVHRDLKPSNIMLTGQGSIKVLDFGIAKLGNAGLTQAGMVVGTPSYMAPEQAMGRKVDQRSDIFALGAVFYEFFTGKRPFVAQDVTSVLYKVVHEEPVPPAAVEPLLPIGLDAIVRRALAKNPQERFQNCDEMREAFRAQAILLAPNASLRNPAPRPAPPVRTPPAVSTTTRSRAIPPPRRRTSWPVVFSCLAVIALIAGFWAGRGHWKTRIGAALEQIKRPGTTDGVKSDASSPGTVVPEAKAATDGGKAQPAAQGTQEPAAATTSPADSQPQPSLTAQPSTSTTAGANPQTTLPAATQPRPPDQSSQPGPPPATGTAATPAADSATAASDAAKTQPGQDDSSAPVASRPKAQNSKSGSGGKIDGFSRGDIPALLRKADAAAGRGEYAVAKYEYDVILRLDRHNAGAIAGLRRVAAAEKEKIR
ncbi:MAG: protein kinase [Acidobacteriia bacterium]|nr:protein kinase [Terriglobia bacterium]